MGEFPAFDHLIILSPHPDDAAYSCGGLLTAMAREGRRVSVLTCFSVSNYIPGRTGLHPAEVSHTRFREDLAFSRHLGDAAAVWPLGFFDVALRPGGREKFLDHQRIADDDMEIARTLSDVVTDLAAPGCAILVPLALGDHIDHRITREGGLRAVAEAGLPAAFYEDLPYARDYGPERVEDFVADLSRERGLSLSPGLFVDDGLLADKRAGQVVYASQGGDEVWVALEDYARRLDAASGGERYWWVD